MNWIICLTFVSTSLLVLSLAMLVIDSRRYRRTVSARIKGLSPHPESPNALSLFKEMSLADGSEAQRSSWKGRLQQLIEQAGMKCSIPTLLVASAGIACLASIAGGLQAWWLAVAFAPAGGAIPIAALYWRRRLRRKKLCSQLPAAFAMISRAVKAGQTVPAALQIIAQDFEAPVATEFALCYEQQNLGMSRESALRQLAIRSGIMELQIFVVALLVQARSGGNLVELLDNLEIMIRKRLKLRERVRALTGEGRMQALVLMVLPVAAFVGICVLSPDYAHELLARPWLLALTGATQVAGAIWIQRIVNFDY